MVATRSMSQIAVRDKVTERSIKEIAVERAHAQDFTMLATRSMSEIAVRDKVTERLIKDAAVERACAQDFTMLATRSMSEIAVRDKVTERLIKDAAVERACAQVDNAKLGTIEQDIYISEYFSTCFPGKLRMIVATPRCSGKYYDLDERFLAMGIFIDTLKECLKNDPDIAFTPQFYHAAMLDFDSLNEDDKAVYIAEAQKRNSIEDNDVAASKKVRKSLKNNNDLAKRKRKRYNNNDWYANHLIEEKAVNLYHNAAKAERLSFTVESYRPSYYLDLNDDERVPYLAEATTRFLDEHVENLKKFNEQEVY